jgi:hypothetical protein
MDRKANNGIDQPAHKAKNENRQERRKLKPKNMQQVIQSQGMQTNCFTVARVANGWLVRMPNVVYQQQENPYEGLVPAFKEMLKLRDEDPLLSQLRAGEEGAEFVAPTVQKMPVIGRDELLYVCKTFQEMVELLLTKFGNLKG